MSREDQIAWLSADRVEQVSAGAGTYVLLFDLARPLRFEVGRLGPISLPAGRLLYVGSARGPGGLRARLRRHVSHPPRSHWHVDHLTQICRPVAVAFATGGQTSECGWARRLRAAGALSPVPGFGSSDCRQGCPAHLLWLAAGAEIRAWIVDDDDRPHP